MDTPYREPAQKRPLELLSEAADALADRSVDGAHDIADLADSIEVLINTLSIALVRSSDASKHDDDLRAEQELLNARQAIRSALRAVGVEPFEHLSDEGTE